jgi:hypothetical protein
VLVAWLIAIVIFGPPAREPDEGTAAHLFQIWLVLEALIVAYFAFTWLPRMPKQALMILALQIVVAPAACAPVAYFNL